MKRRLMAVLAAAALISSLCGCWDYREVESLANVAGMAVDKAEEPGHYRVTLDVVNLVESGKESSPESLLLEAQGATLSDALVKAGELIGMELYWSPLRIVIISREVAEEGISPIVDWFLLNSEPRPNIELIISGEKTAAEILRAKPLTNKVASFEIDRQLERDAEAAANAYYNQLYRTYNELAAPGRSLVLPCVVLTERDEQEATEVSGSALFSGDRFVEYLDPRRSFYLLMANNQIKSGYLSVKIREESPEVALRIRRSSTSVTVEEKDGKPVFTLSVKTEAQLKKADGSFDLIAEKDISLIEDKTQEMLSRNLKEAVTLVQTEYGTDCFGFGNLVYRTKPKLWEKLESRWSEAFRTAEVRVECKVTVENRTLIKQLFTPSGED